jgi:hypothetical protein
MIILGRVAKTSLTKRSYFGGKLSELITRAAPDQGRPGDHHERPNGSRGHRGRSEGDQYRVNIGKTYKISRGPSSR